MDGIALFKRIEGHARILHALLLNIVALLFLSQRLANIAGFAKTQHQPCDGAEDEKAQAKAGSLAEGL